MRVVKDLVATIALYTTPRRTFDILTIDHEVATALYRAHFWMKKCEKEALGMMVYDSLITKDRAGLQGWYSYYAMRSRTYYGALKFFQRGDSHPMDLSDSSTACLSVGNMNRGYVWQLADYSVVYGDIYQGTTEVFPLRLRERILEYKENRIAGGYALFFLTEYGNLYYYIQPSDTLRLVIRDIATIGVYEVIRRDGRIYVMEFDDYLNHSRCSASYASKDSRSLITKSGRTIDITDYSCREKGTIAIINDNILPGFVLTDSQTPYKYLPIIAAGKWLYWHDTHLDVVTNDRTLHLDRTQRPHSIENIQYLTASKHVTNSVVLIVDQ